MVEKNEEQELPIPHIWRPIFKEIVQAFVRKDYTLSQGIEHVAPISASTAKQIKEYIEDYGEELIELPEETWESSAYLYQGGYWDVLVDLWTKGEGRSDLVLQCNVREQDTSYEVEIYLVYVP